MKKKQQIKSTVSRTQIKKQTKQSILVPSLVPTLLGHPDHTSSAAKRNRLDDLSRKQLRILDSTTHSILHHIFHFTSLLQPPTFRHFEFLTHSFLLSCTGSRICFWIPSCSLHCLYLTSATDGHTFILSQLHTPDSVIVLVQTDNCHHFFLAFLSIPTYI